MTRNALFVVFFMLITSSVAMAGGLDELLAGAKVLVDATGYSNRGSNQPATVALPTQFEEKYRLEWEKQEVVDASGRCSYLDGWRRYDVDRQLVKSAITAAGQKVGVLLVANDNQPREAQSRSSKPGYNPEYAPKQGLWRAPQGIIQATITFAGYSCTEKLQVERKWGMRGARLMHEEYRVSVELVVFSIETLEPVASAKADGSTSSEFVDGEVEIKGLEVGGLYQKRARPDRAYAEAADRAMAQLASQLLGNYQSQVDLVVAEINGSEVIITTSDDSPISAQGVVAKLNFAVRGAGVINPITGQPSRGSRPIGTIIIDWVNGSLAGGTLLPDSRIPQVGCLVTLEPYQDLHQIP